MPIVRKAAIYLILFSGLLLLGNCSPGSDGPASDVAACGEISGEPVDISGIVSYEDKEYDKNGFTGRSDYFKAVRFAKIQVVDSTDDAVLAEGVTGSTGDYSMQFTPKCASVYVKVIASTDMAGEPEVEVRKTKSGDLHFFRGSDIDLGGYSTLEYDISVLSDMSNVDEPVLSDNSTAGAFNILDMMTIGGEFTGTFSGEVPPLLNAYWEKEEQTPGGTSYYCTGLDTLSCPRGEGIYVLGGGGDTDEYDDDVLLHEYGHFAAAKKSRDDSPGGPHALTDNDLDLRLAWSEGWGDFFPAAVKVWLNENNPEYLSLSQSLDLSMYVDTSTSVFWFDIAAPSSAMVSSANEVAVANVLWKTMNGFENGTRHVWDVFSDYIPDVTTPVNLEAFWDGWLFLKTPTAGGRALLDAYFLDREINYFKDNFEPDSEIAGAGSHLINGSEDHTFYRDDLAANDIDYISFDVTAGQDYTVQTYNLTNGADTYIRVLESDGSLIVLNDDSGEPGQLKSKASFTSPISGTLYVEVSTSPNKSDASGNYGSYSISVTAP